MTSRACTASANPFASRYINALPYRAHGVDAAVLCEHLDNLGGRAAIVGPHGAGKTTLMGQMASALASHGWRVHAFRTRAGRGQAEEWLATAYSVEDAVLVDGAGHLGPLARRRLFRWARTAGRVLVTAHHPVGVPTLHRCEPSLTLLDALVGELAGPRAADLRPVSHDLYAVHRGNMRDVLRGLYDHCAGLS